jgi:hypothetical protein
MARGKRTADEQGVRPPDILAGSPWRKSRGACLRPRVAAVVVETRRYFVQYCCVSTPRHRPDAAAHARAGLLPRTARVEFLRAAQGPAAAQLHGDFSFRGQKRQGNNHKYLSTKKLRICRPRSRPQRGRSLSASTLTTVKRAQLFRGFAFPPGLSELPRPVIVDQHPAAPPRAYGSLRLLAAAANAT